MEQKELIIIGAGPAGLRAGEEAQRLRLDYLIIEQGKVGQAWREIRANMPMLSPGHPQRDWTSISPRFPIWKQAVKRPYCSAQEFVNYLQAYADHFSLQLATDTVIHKIEKTDNYFKLVSSRNEIRAQIILVCTGMFGNPYIPDIPGLRGHAQVIHSHFYKTPDSFKGQRVIIIGGGNSGAEIAVDLAGSAQVFLMTRDRLKFFSATKNLCDIRGISESYLLELIAMKLIRHVQQADIRRVKGTSLQLDRTTVQFDRIICATGYQPVLNLLSALPLKLDRQTQFPSISAGAEAHGIKNLFFAGPLAYRGMGSLFIHGFIKDIPRILLTIHNRIHSKVPPADC
jgi:cation diffusion facilitator CzcD-associated flavoprotein CzcO